MEKSYLKEILKDDNTTNGGISFLGETLQDFLDDLGIDYRDTTLKEVNSLLAENGIKPIKKQESKSMKAIIVKQLRDGYKGIIARKENGWTNEELNTYTAGVSNTLFDFINNLQSGGLITEKEAEEIEEVFSNTIDTLEF